LEKQVVAKLSWKRKWCGMYTDVFILRSWRI
jgi:hypothetical protein